jgi:hypothetical protein
MGEGEGGGEKEIGALFSTKKETVKWGMAEGT